MHQRRLGARGPVVSAIGLGCLSFGGLFGPTDEGESLACLDAAWEGGITFLDVANVYGDGRAEAVIGRWLASRRHCPVIATKAGIVPGAQRGVDNSPAHLRAALDGSLRRLGVERVDLFYLHRHDPAVPIEEVAGTMAALVAAGKIAGYGLSEVAPWTVARAHAVHPVTAVQNEYSLWTRQPELGLLRTCEALGVAFVAFSPLARGALGEAPMHPGHPDLGPFRARMPRFAPEHWPANAARLAGFRRLAAAMGWTPSALALAWLLARGGHVLPIPGTRRATSLRAWAAAGVRRLTAEESAAVEAVLPAGWAHGDRYDDAAAASVERYC